jgi:ribose 5-phosphate isomerase A
MNKEIREFLGSHAANLIEDNMIVGLGTGRTANSFVKALAKRCELGLKIKAVASSLQTEKLSSQLGIDVLNINDVDRIDVTVDGADEVDEERNIIKGGGGALLREKILSFASDKFVVLIEDSKLVKKIGEFPLPVEIVPYGCWVAKKKIELLNLECKWRMNEEEFFLTDNNNFLLDIYFNSFIEDPIELQEALKNIPGVVETGLFLNMADQILIGSSTKTVTIL